MGFTKIETADLVGKGVVGLPDTPNLSTTAMQEKLDELALQVIVPIINFLVLNFVLVIIETKFN